MWKKSNMWNFIHAFYCSNDNAYKLLYWCNDFQKRRFLFNWTQKTTDVKKQSFLFVACVRFTSSWHRLHVVSVLFPVVWAAVVKDIVTVFTAVLFAAKLHTCVIRFKANRTGVAAGAGVGAVVGAGTGEGESCRRHSLHYHHRQHKDRLLQ